MMLVIRTGIQTAGIAIGTAFILRRRMSCISYAETGDPAIEAVRFDVALERTKAELDRLSDGNAIFAAHLEMTDDPVLVERVGELIGERRFSAEKALDTACKEVCEMLAALDDEYLRGRVDDVRDVCARICRHLNGDTTENPFANIPRGAIVVANELVPSDTALMDFSRIAGLVTACGSATSHVCIIARSKDIAAMVGLGKSIHEIKHGNRLIINGEAGELIVNPDPETEREYMARIRSQKQSDILSQSVANTPAITRRGRRIAVMGNAGSVEEVRHALDAGAEGIGLFRSEFLYMQSRDGFPDERSQFEAYLTAAELCEKRPLVIRTLDVGGDKALSYMNLEQEKNPFLGWRAIRISLAMPDVFRTQLRALLRASAYGNLRIMLPMITSIGEFRQAKTIVRSCMAELDAEKIAYDRHVRLGVMIETPAAVLIADLLAAEADFFSIGTNDLTQYIMAADRGNPRVSHLYDPFDVAVQRSIEWVLKAAKNANIEVSMCGELAADPRATSWLLGSGLEKFSVSASAVGPLKQRIRTFK